MITLIARSTTIIGFGLCGIDNVVEIDGNTRSEDVQRIVENVTTPIIMLDERYVEDISTERIIIPIPDRYANAPKDRMAELVRDVVGGDSTWE